MRTIELTAYSFDELSKEAKEKAIERFQNINVEHDWYDFVFDDAKTIASLMGIDIKRIFFSGFWSQGDGACFEGDYSYKKDSVKAVKEYAPTDEKLHSIVERLSAIQKSNFYKLSARVEHSGYYYHSKCTTVHVYKDGNYTSDENETILTECLRDMMDWIYSQLEKEYEWNTCESSIIEAIESNGYEFTIDGKLI